jgi:hypothetical protein
MPANVDAKSDITTIQISKKTGNEYIEMGKKGEIYEVINRLIKTLKEFGGGYLSYGL